MILDTLKKQYDGQPIATIESDFIQYRDLAAANRKDFILGLYYLDRTKRFKENKLYKNSTFERYIGDVFSMKYHAYDKERFSFIAHPEASEKFGPGLVARIKDTCGAEKVNDVVKAIDDARDVKTIDKIIDKNAKPSKKDRKAKADKADETKKTIEAENSRHVKTIAEYIKNDGEQQDRIAKLLQTIMELKAENAALKADNEKLKKENDDFRKYSTANPFYANMSAFDNQFRAAA